MRLRPSAALPRLLATLALLLPVAVLAGPYDFELRRLGNPDPAGPGHQPLANDNFRIFARQLGAAISSTNLMPPETLGHSGFAINAELSAVHFETEEFVFPTRAPLRRGNMLIPSLHLRKGLPFSLEVGTRVGWIEKSEMGLFTLEGKWAISEGYSYLPDIGLRGHGTRLVNGRDFDLTTLGLDLSIGKQVAVASMFTLTPYVGWNLVFVQAESKAVDFRPERDPHTVDLSTLVSDQSRFEQVGFGANSHNRFYAGLRFIGDIVQLGVELSLSTLGTVTVVDANDEDPQSDRIQRRLPVVPALNSTIGVDF